jgi:colanic acid/amylovoran biosynthesis glycosyltransferase
VSSFPRRWGGLSRHLLRGLFRDGDLMLVLSEDMGRDLVELGCPKAKVKVQHLGIDVSSFAFRSPRAAATGEPAKFVAVGRMVEKKGFVPLIEAFARAHREQPMRLTIAGDGPQRAQIDELVDRHGLADAVELLGPRPHAEISRVMAAADLFVLPSVTAAEGDKEGTPTVLMEAMATGLPVVSTHHAGIPEVVHDGEHGLLVPERDIDALARALVTAANAVDRWPR